MNDDFQAMVGLQEDAGSRPSSNAASSGFDAVLNLQRLG